MKQDFFVKCKFQLNKITGSQGATAVLSVLEYRFEKQPDGFYKFIEPCAHRLYKEGDSLSEELGVERKTIARAFKKIGIKYKSRTDFENAADKFQGKLYASYYERHTNLTFFVRNHDLVDELLEKYCGTKTRNIQKKPTISQKPLIFNGKNPFRNDQCVPSHIEAKNTSNNLSKDKSHASNEIEKKMIEIWAAVMGHGKDQIELTSRRIAFLKQAFKDKFDSCLDKWKNYCQDIASSRFLMGEIKSSFRATLDWALKFDSIQKVFDGNYGIGDRKQSLEPSAAESFLKNSKLELDSEEEEIQKSTCEPEPIRAFRVKWLKKFGENNYRETLKDCVIKVTNDSTLIIHPSSRYNAKSIVSYWTPTLLDDSPFVQVHIFQQEGDHVFDKWFGKEQSRVGAPPENDVVGVNNSPVLTASPIVKSLPEATDIVEADPVIQKFPEEFVFVDDGKLTGEFSVTTETQMLRRKLRQSLPKNQLPSWLGALEVESICQDGTVVVTLDDSLAVGWCRSRFSNEILQLATTLWRGVNRLVIREKEGDTPQSSIENSSKKSENIEDKSTLEQAIQSFLLAASQNETCQPMKMARIY